MSLDLETIKQRLERASYVKAVSELEEIARTDLPACVAEIERLREEWYASNRNLHDAWADRDALQARCVALTEALEAAVDFIAWNNDEHDHWSGCAASENKAPISLWDEDGNWDAAGFEAWQAETCDCQLSVLKAARTVLEQQKEGA